MFEVGGTVFGISSTVVMPPAAAACEPVSKSSLYVSPGSRKWTCGSIRPGSTWKPLASMTSRAGGRSSRTITSSTWPSLMRTCPRRLDSGVTIVPFLTMRSTAMPLLLLPGPQPDPALPTPISSSPAEAHSRKRRRTHPQTRRRRPEPVELLPRRSEIARVEIGRDRRGAAHGVGQGHVPVGPHEIDGIAPQAGSTHLRAPCKDMQRQCSPVTHGLDLGRGAAVHVDLPVQRRQRREVVLPDAVHVRPHPRQTVAAVNRPRAALAQTAS